LHNKGKAIPINTVGINTVISAKLFKSKGRGGPIANIDAPNANVTSTDTANSTSIIQSVRIKK